MRYLNPCSFSLLKRLIHIPNRFFQFHHDLIHLKFAPRTRTLILIRYNRSRPQLILKSLLRYQFKPFILRALKAILYFPIIITHLIQTRLESIRCLHKLSQWQIIVYFWDYKLWLRIEVNRLIPVWVLCGQIIGFWVT